MKTALIIGGDSTIGSALAAHLSSHNIQCFTTSRRAKIPLTLDLSEIPKKWPELPHTDVTYLCAAATKLEACEKNAAAAHLINVTHMQALAQRVQEKDSFVVFLSSNQVFDGNIPYRKTTDATCPMNNYGKQKAAFEEWLLERPQAASVLRLTKIISTLLPILMEWETALKKGEIVEAFDDLIFAPLPLQAALDALQNIGTNKRSGIFHLSGTHDISYYEIAQKLAEKIGVNIGLVRPVSTTSKGILPQFLPKYGTLECSKFEGVVIPDVEKIIF